MPAIAIICEHTFMFNVSLARPHDTRRLRISVVVFAITHNFFLKKHATVLSPLNPQKKAEERSPYRMSTYVQVVLPLVLADLLEDSQVLLLDAVVL